MRKAAGLIFMLVGTAALTGATSAQAAPSAVRRIGLTTDAGVPDGLAVGLAVRPIRPIRLGLAVATNGVGPGGRVGLTIKTPTALALSATAEAGFFPPMNANPVVGAVMGVPSSIGVLEKVGYSYGSLRAGLEFGDQRATFMLHVGMSEMHANLRRVDELLVERAETIELAPIHLRVLAPSARLGVLFWFKRRNR